MLFLYLLVYLCVASCQLDVIQSTTLNELTEALLALGLPNATSFLNAHNVVAYQTAARGTELSRCNVACDLLRDILNMNNSRPLNYDPQYWAQQQKELTPTCYVTPGTGTYAAGTLLILEYFQCPFAVRSGGHAPFGSAVADPGVVVDLRTFHTLALSADRSVVTIGTAAKWIKVVDGLGVLGFMVPAASCAFVGVGGYTLQGGFSFASNRYGLAADNVVSFEIVLANGSIVQASPNEHADLYWALRGGGGQTFGIVTKFDFLTFPVPPKFFGGIYNTGLNESASVFDAFEDFVLHRQGRDSGAQFACTVSPSGTHSILTHLDGESQAQAFELIRRVPSTYSSLKIKTMSQFMRELARISPSGNREMYATFTVSIHARWMKECSAIFLEEVRTLNSSINGRMLNPGLSFTSISQGIVQRAMARGGNTFDFQNQTSGLLMIAHIGFGWFSSSDDFAVHAAAKVITSRCTAAAAESGLQHPFLYPGYASNEQDTVFDNSGTANQQRLEAIAAAYDPYGWLQRLQPPRPTLA